MMFRIVQLLFGFGAVMGLGQAVSDKSDKCDKIIGYVFFMLFLMIILWIEGGML